MNMGMETRENTVNNSVDFEGRWKILKSKKRQNLDKMKRIKRSYVKAKLEKKRINREVKQLQKEWKERIAANPAEAKSVFNQELQNVTMDDMFPKDLEREFDKIELRNIKKGRTMKVEDLSEDADLRHVPSVADALEHELDDELKDKDEVHATHEATEPDDDTKAMLDREQDIGLTTGDLFIGEDGHEQEVTSHDEDR